MNKKIYIFLSLLSLSMFAGAANATLFTFSLADSEAGNARPPTYGLRLDGLYSGDPSHIYTFAFVDVGMEVDSDADTVFLGGTLLGGSEVTALNPDAGEDRNMNWMFEFTYTGMIVDDSNGSWEFDDINSGGTGSITKIGMPNEIFTLTQHMGSDGFGPDVNCRAGDGPWCGNGWLNHSVNSNISGLPSEIDTHLSSSDFLYIGTPIPEPSIIALFGMGLVGLGIARRRRQF